jgi:hypothetical protein
MPRMRFTIMLKMLKNELVIFYSSVSVRAIYIAICLIAILAQVLLPYETSMQLAAPGFAAQAAIGAFYGVVVAFLTGKAFEKDLKNGTIINVLSCGTGRTAYFAGKCILLLIHSFLFPLMLSLVVLAFPLIKGIGDVNIPVEDIIISNIISFVLLFLMTFAESLIATVFYMLLSQFISSVIVSALVAFSEYLITLVIFRNVPVILSPIGIFIKVVNRITVDNIKAVFLPATVMLVIYISVFGYVFYLQSKRSEY